MSSVICSGLRTNVERLKVNKNGLGDSRSSFVFVVRWFRYWLGFVPPSFRLVFETDILPRVRTGCLEPYSSSRVGSKFWK